MEEVIKFNEENKYTVMPYFGQEQMITAQEKASLRNKKYRDTLHERTIVILAKTALTRQCVNINSTP